MCVCVYVCVCVCMCVCVTHVPVGLERLMFLKVHFALSSTFLYLCSLCFIETVRGEAGSWPTGLQSRRGHQRKLRLQCQQAPVPQQPVAQPLTKLLMFCKECANCRNESKCGQKTLLVLRTSDGTNLVKLVKCPKGGGRCSTENQFQAWVSSGLFGNSPIWGPALNCVSGRDC